MFAGRASSWNLRDRHMAETIGALADILRRRGVERRSVVGEHNTHLGAARATQMGRGGELNVGQLMRERYGPDVVNIGFTTSSGTVTAASDWDGPAERKRVRPAIEGSYEGLFHESGVANFLFPLRGNARAASLGVAHVDHAMRVIYDPR